jgi:hypothetical protein
MQSGCSQIVSTLAKLDCSDDADVPDVQHDLCEAMAVHPGLLAVALPAVGRHDRLRLYRPRLWRRRDRCRHPVEAALQPEAEMSVRGCSMPTFVPSATRVTVTVRSLPVYGGSGGGGCWQAP